MKFDPSGINSALDAMQTRAHKGGRELIDVIADEFVRDIKKESWKIAPTTDDLVQTAKKLKWKLKRKPGVSPQKELARRIRARGTFARKWRILKKENMRVTLIDVSAESEKVDNRTKVSDKAESITGKKFRDRVDKLADKLATMF